MPLFVVRPFNLLLLFLMFFTKAKEPIVFFLKDLINNFKLISKIVSPLIRTKLFIPLFFKECKAPAVPIGYFSFIQIILVKLYVFS